MDDWERHVTPLLQDMGCANEDAQDDFFNQQDIVNEVFRGCWYNLINVPKSWLDTSTKERQVVEEVVVLVFSLLSPICGVVAPFRSRLVLTAPELRLKNRDPYHPYRHLLLILVAIQYQSHIDLANSSVISYVFNEHPVQDVSGFGHPS
ncbi:unnamed protein product [Spodoptera exigua]|nr:unnamed protein product [Spodoptera exigua]